MPTTDEIYKKYYGSTKHPYKLYEEYIQKKIRDDSIILDAGCGRNAPILQTFSGKKRRLIGVDLENKGNVPNHIEYIQSDISSINIMRNSIDIVISRAVIEHLENPELILREIHRILKPGGCFIFLAPNLWDYSALFSRIIPNKYHKFIVSKIEGRCQDDVFPAYYRANTYNSIQKLCDKINFEIITFKYIGQYPSYFMFNSFLFLIATVYDKLISRYHCLRHLRGWILAEIRKQKCDN